ncbi:SAM-dependent methyltransferase [bacterium]|nr:SAM-dependent methyltransferase [bacterium]|tara:strand:+ start:13851 stop:15038 length:1188 start_codon:yes stop_codon:yes gene_type:complete
MSYYSIPANNNTFDLSSLYINTNNDISKNNLYYISKTLNDYILKNKGRIENHQNDWDIIKKYVNPYEFIHTQVPYCKTSVGKYKPISRSYFKFIEISSLLNIVDSITHPLIKSFHLAEGPGGFIEALANLRKNDQDQYTGMTLISSDSNIPGWKKSAEILKKNPNISIEKGESGTGDILLSDNYIFCSNKYNNSMNIITADGGFDFSIDFNMQEAMSSKLILAEALYAITLQKRDGHFILKIFDNFTRFTCELIYLLSMFYEKVYIVKPHTSRYANSERYIVCKHFKYHNTIQLVDTFSKILEKISEHDYIDSIFNFELPYIFTTRIEEINAVLGQQQIECIVNTLNLINHKNKNDKLEQIKNNHINKCTNWCVRHKQPYYKTIQQNNIFLSSNN